MKRVAQRIVDTHNAGHRVVVVVSAMGDDRHDLLDSAAALWTLARPRNGHHLSAGKRISMALLAMAVNELGVEPAPTPARAAASDRQPLPGRPDRRPGPRARRPRHQGRPGRHRPPASRGHLQGRRRDDAGPRKRHDRRRLAAALRRRVRNLHRTSTALFSATTAHRPQGPPPAHPHPGRNPGNGRAHGSRSSTCAPSNSRAATQVPLRALLVLRKNGTWISDSPQTPNSRPRARRSPKSLPRENAMEKPVISGIAHDRSQDKITVTDVPNPAPRRRPRLRRRHRESAPTST